MVSQPAMTPFEDLCWQHISSARWFGGKGRDARLVSVQPLPQADGSAASLPGAGVRTFLAKVAYADATGDNTPHWYQLVFCLFAEDATADAEVLGVVDVPDAGRVQVTDASRSETGQRLLLQQLLRGEGIATGPLRHQQVVLQHHDAGVDLPPRVFGGEQSNTSIMYGKTAMLKLFRRLEIGRNLDIEVHDALARKEGATSAVAHLFGWSEAAWADTDETQCQADLSMLVEQFREASDGWDLAVEAASTRTDFTADAAELGGALRHIHLSLADSFGMHEISGAEVSQQMVARLDAALPVVPQLAEYADGLTQTFRGIVDYKIPAQRVHGDFHLGQTLKSTDADGRRTWKIIDFEGEPLKSMIERRLPDTPWRDVAGMLRSFDYAAATAIERGVAAEDARRWSADAIEAFVKAYFGESEIPSNGDNSVLRAYIADKAVYETVYEARNRPHWLAIPLNALAQLAQPEKNQNITPHHNKMEAQS